MNSDTIASERSQPSEMDSYVYIPIVSAFLDEDNSSSHVFIVIFITLAALLSVLSLLKSDFVILSCFRRYSRKFNFLSFITVYLCER